MAMSSLDKLPKHSEVIYALTPLADKYFDIGMQLDLDYEQLKAIENDHKGNQSRCLIETIILWRCCHSGECSWSTLAEAVKRVGGHDKLVRELKKRDTAKDLMETDSKARFAQMHHPPERANEGTQSSPQHNSRESEYESGYSSISDSVQSGDSTGSEAECFELAPGCGCPAAGKTPCSLYTFCGGECSNPTRKRVPVLRKKSKVIATSSQSEIPFEEEYDFEDYEEKTKKMHKSFGIFLCDTSHHFETSKVDIQKLTLYVQGAYPVMKPRMEELSKATNFEYFFRIIVDQACSWFDYGIIKDLILLFCASAKSCLDQYETCFKKYAEQRLPKGMKHIEIGGGARKEGKQLVIKIDREWEEVTFSDLDKLRGTFASILDIRRSDLYLADIREGCIMMTFMITEELAGRLFPSTTCLTSSQVQTLKDEGVLSVKCGNLSWRAVASNNKSCVASCRRETRAKVVCKKLN